MWTRQHKQRTSGRWIVPVMTALVLAYFFQHAYRGAYGIDSNHELAKRLTALQAELTARTKEREDLEQRVSLLRDGSIEKDMLDEYARRELDFSRANELVIMLPGKSAN